MAKYSFEFKLKVVNDYLSGIEGYQFLSTKYGLSNHEMLHKWGNAYKEFGAEGLRKKRQNNVYDSDFKLNAVNLYLTSEKSYCEVANQLVINNRSLIVRWVQNYRQKENLLLYLVLVEDPEKREQWINQS